MIKKRDSGYYYAKGIVLNWVGIMFLVFSVWFLVYGYYLTVLILFISCLPSFYAGKVALADYRDQRYQKRYKAPEQPILDLLRDNIKNRSIDNSAGDKHKQESNENESP